MYLTAYFLFKFIALCVLRLKVKGREHIPQDDQPLIIVANHETEIDSFLISLFFSRKRRVHWIAKRELCDAKSLHLEYFLSLRKHLGQGAHTWLCAWALAGLVALLIRGFPVIPVDREKKLVAVNVPAILKSNEILKKGGLLGIFPEGGIDRKGQVHALFVALAQACEVPILPVSIDISTREMVFCVPIMPHSLANIGKDAEAQAREIMNMIYSAV